MPPQPMTTIIFGKPLQIVFQLLFHKNHCFPSLLPENHCKSANGLSPNGQSAVYKNDQ